MNNKQKAVSDVGYAIKQGIIPNVSTHECQICGSKAENYHHPDYDKPLDVIPLCRKCHLKLHARIRRAEIEKTKDSEIQIGKLSSNGITKLHKPMIVTYHIGRNVLGIIIPIKGRVEARMVIDLLDKYAVNERNHTQPQRNDTEGEDA